MKIYNIINGIFYIAYGLFGAFLPASMARIMGRAMSMAMAAMGLAAFLSARKSQDQSSLTRVFVLLTLAFAVGRILGLIFDGLGPTQTYGEITFELIWSGIGLFLLKRG